MESKGLLRQFFPKDMDFGKIIQLDVDITLELLNNRPQNFKLSDPDRGLLEQTYVLRFRLKFGSDSI